MTMQQHDADHPVEFVRRLVAAAIKDVEHVPEHDEHHQLRRQPMQIAEKDAVGNDEPQILHVPIGLRHGRVVVEHQAGRR